MLYHHLNCHSILYKRLDKAKRILQMPKLPHSPRPVQTYRLPLFDSDKYHSLQQPQPQQPLLFSISIFSFSLFFKFTKSVFLRIYPFNGRTTALPHQQNSLSLPHTSFPKGDGAPGAYLRQQINQPGVSFLLCFVLCSFHNLKTPFNFLLPVIPSIVEGSHYAPEKY